MKLIDASIQNKLQNKLFILSLFSLIITTGGLAFGTAYADTQNINAVAVEINGTKFWLPSIIMAKKGDTVKIHAISKIPGQNNVHGLAIDAFKVQALVTEKPIDLEFTADKAGIFPIRCHLHPGHIGGQLLVTE